MYGSNRAECKTQLIWRLQKKCQIYVKMIAKNRLSIQLLVEFGWLKYS